ncbi:MAG: CAP domain-containing protein [Pricia sp.]
MRRFRLSCLVASAFLLLVSCSKDSAADEEGTTGPETENPETDKPGSDNPEKDEAERAAAKELYADYYLASMDAQGDVSWTGNLPSCNPGTVPQATKDKILMRLAYYRQAAGLNNVISENPTKSEKAQKAALMMFANGTLNHYPPNDWDCYTDDGYEGASNSLLTSTRNAGAIDSYIRDHGADNFPVGHRRWLFWPRLQEIGIGNTSSYNAVWVIGNGGTPPDDAPDFVAWPPEGYLPKQLAYARWSFSIAEADFSGATVSVKLKNGSNVSLEKEEQGAEFGDKTLVWRPEINTNALTEDTTYVVTLTDVGIDGEMKDFEYEVTLFDVDL